MLTVLLEYILTCTHRMNVQLEYTDQTFPYYAYMTQLPIMPKIMLA